MSSVVEIKGRPSAMPVTACSSSQKDVLGKLDKQSGARVSRMEIQGVSELESSQNSSGKQPLGEMHRRWVGDLQPLWLWEAPKPTDSGDDSWEVSQRSELVVSFPFYSPSPWAGEVAL